MIRYTPPKTNRAGIILPAILFAACLLCLISGAYGLGHRFILQLCGVVCATAGIQITTRYQLSEFIYTLGPAGDFGEQLSFGVTKRQGKKSTAVCNLSLETMIGMEKKGKIRELEKKYGRLHRHFNFCNNLFPLGGYMLLIKFNEEIIALSFEPNQAMLEMLETYQKQKKGEGEG